MHNTDIKQMLSDQSEQVKKLHEIVEKTLSEEKLIINNLLNPPKEIITPGQSISDKVAIFGGSWKFIIIFAIILTAWILYNSIAPNGLNFDPYPYILMNLILSTIAALQAPVIMMSQNRQEENDRMRSENDYLINLKAEMEIRSLNQKIDLLLEEQIKTLFESQAKQFDLLENMSEKINSLCKQQ